MKTGQNIRTNEKRHSNFRPALAALLVAAAPAKGLSDEATTNTTSTAAAPAAPAPAEKPAPLPLHQIEGSGGIFSTLSAYIVNPPRDGELVGRPSVGFAHVSLGFDKNLEALTITESPLKRLELGYGWDYLGLGDLPQALRSAGLQGYHQDEVQLHNFNVRYQILKEGEFDQKWIPALTAGVHYKYNDGISEVNNQVGGLLGKVAHIPNNDGTDVTLYASKMFTQLPRPVLLEVGGRATEAVWDGLGGFTESYNFVFEANAVVFVTGSFALAAEYKQQPTDYTPIGNLVRVEDDWWTIDAARTRLLRRDRRCSRGV